MTCAFPLISPNYILSFPTTVTDSSSNVLDLVQSADPHLVRSLSPIDGVNHHKALHCFIDIKLQKSVLFLKKNRFYHRSDYDMINRELSEYVVSFNENCVNYKANKNAIYIRPNYSSLSNVMCHVKMSNLMHLSHGSQLFFTNFLTKRKYCLGMLND